MAIPLNGDIQGDFLALRHCFRTGYQAFLRSDITRSPGAPLISAQRRNLTIQRSSSLTALVAAVLCLLASGSASAMSAQELFDDGNRLFRDDLYWAALLRYEQAGEAGMSTALLDYNTGVAHYKAGQHIRARESLKKATRSSRLEPMAHFNLGIAYGSLGMNKEVVRAYENAVKINPDFIRARYNLGVAYLNISKPERAYDEYKKIKHANPELAGRLFNLIDQEWKRLKKAGKPA